MPKLLSLADRHPRWAAILLGLLAATGFPPLALWPAGVAALAGFGWLLWRTAGWRQATLLGWLFGVAHFTLANNWIATAFTFQAEMPAALGWAAVPLLALYLAVFPAIGCGIAKALAPRTSLATFAPALGAGWILGEWLRSWVFTGYAWAPLSLMLVGPYERPGAAVALPLAGTYALSGLLMAGAALLAGAAKGRRWLPAAGLCGALTAAMLWPASAPRQGTLPFTLVQPNLGQNEINDASRFETQFQRIAGLTRPRAPAPRRLILWSESAVPDYLEPGYPQRYYDQMTARGDPGFARARIGRAGGPGAMVLTGAVNLQFRARDGDPLATGAYNSVLAIAADGGLAGRYDKAHLVPYGEYLPMRPILEPLGLTRLVAGSIDFIPGPGPRTVDLGPWGKAGMQICYEIVFSGEVVDRRNRPDYIFNPSNDGWFGRWGPPQHLAQARMRAIEEGLPIIRATPTGISAIIAADGRLIATVPHETAGAAQAPLPAALPPTVFSRVGNMLALLIAMALAAIGVAIRRRRR